MALKNTNPFMTEGFNPDPATGGQPGDVQTGGPRRLGFTTDLFNDFTSMGHRNVSGEDDFLSSLINSMTEGIKSNTGRTSSVTDTTATTDREGTVEGNTLGSVTGKQSSTQKTGISQEGLNFLLAQQLGGVNGLAQLVSGQNAAGVYDSATTALLASDFVTRAAGEVQARNITTVEEGITGQEQRGSSLQRTSDRDTTVSEAFSNASSYNREQNRQNTEERRNNEAHRDTASAGTDTEMHSDSGFDRLNAGLQSSPTHSVLCTQLYKSGILPLEDYCKLATFTLKYSKYVMRGYHLWAIPCVKAMRLPGWKGRISTSIMAFIVLNWIEAQLRGKITFFGIFSKWIGEPICYILGKYFVDKKELLKRYKSLYVNNEVEAGA